jgi:hypothetical protein
MRILRSWRLALAPIAFAAVTAGAQGHVTSPKEFFGHNIGDDYWLPNYDQFLAYWKKIDQESDRMQSVEIGKSSEGRPQMAAIITAPENFKLLKKYQDISMRLAKGEGLTDVQAHELAKEGKAVVWFDGGLHATEVLGANQLIETTYQLLTRNDDETKRILHDDIILAVHANPDGMQLVADWYMKDKDSLARSMNIPRLYNKYAGHDDNRDSFMSNLNETKNINHFMFWDWHPVIMYNHHQTGPAGTVMFSPPFRDPFNYNLDRARHGRCGDPPASARGEQAGLHDALGLELLDVVERRSTHDRLLPGHHRHSHGIDRQSDARADPVHPRAAAAAWRPPGADRTAGLALSAVDRLLGVGELRDLRPRVAVS